MSKVRVYEMAKKLNVSSKDLINKLSSMDIKVQSHMSTLTEEQVKRLSNNNTTKKEHNETKSTATSKPKSEETVERKPQGSTTTTTNNRENTNQGGYRNNNRDGQNSNYRGNRDNNQGGYRNNNRDGQNSNYRGNRDNNQGGYRGNNNRDGQNSNYRGNRDNNQGGYRGNNNRDGQNSNYRGNNQGGYRNNNGEGQNSNYRGNRDNNQSGGYRGNNNRDGQNSNYRGNRDNNQGGGYRGNNNRDGQNSNYRGNRDNNQSGGYRGNNNRDGQNSNYRGNRDNNQGGGYRGNNNRDGQNSNYRGNNQGGGYRGNNNRDGQNSNYRGNNQGGGYRGNNNRDGQNSNYRGNNQGGGYRGNNNSGGGYRGNNNNSGGGYRGNNNNSGGGYRGNNNSGGGYRGNNNSGGGGYRGNNNNRNNSGGNGLNIKIKTDSYNKPAPSTTSTSGKPKTNYGNKRKDKERFDKTGGKTFRGFEKPKKQKKSKKHYKMMQEKQDEQAMLNIVPEDLGVVPIPERIVVKDLAEKLHKPTSDIVKYLMLKGIMATLNHEIEFALAEEIALEYNIEVELEEEVDLFEEYFTEEEDAPETLKERPPVVVVMGHVDHGKTSILDALRSSNVTDSEAGGITQHIGASVVKCNDKDITFLDTPGHEAFTAMRMRGAQVTDIAILVVAADDGVMPQTIEAINHAKAAEVEIIVAINKMDKPGANPDRVKQELSEHGVVPEDWGGDTICVPCSAMTKEGLDKLLEMVLIVSELAEYKANPDREARGNIIEAKLDKGRGTVATVLVKNGTLNQGDSVVAGSAYGRVRAMVDDKGRKLKEAGPSTPVEIIGLSEVPVAGDRFFVTKNDREARQLAEMVQREGRIKMISNSNQRVTLDDLFNQIQAGKVKELSIIVKADTQGSVEAVKSSLQKLSNDEVVIKPIHGGVGGVTESDVLLASASNSVIIGFNVRPDATAVSVANQEGVDIRLYRIIYNAIEDIEAAMKGMLDPEFKEKVIGQMEIRETFKVSGVGTIGGAYVLDGYILRSSQVRVVRDGIVVHEGELASLKRFKDDVKEVKTGYECGVMVERFNDIKIGDKIEAFIMEEIPR